MLIFLSGGVRSGKSSLAEKLAAHHQSPGGRLIYIACGQHTDREMDERIEHHKQRRAESGHHWITAERPVEVASVDVKASDTILIDCVTTLLAGEYFRKDKPASGAASRIIEDILMLAGRAHAVVAVSNELSFEAPAGELTADYTRKLGAIHQRLVQESSTAILVEHGIPIIKKGGIECGGL
ncbi:bifunctional adenosylcobinamide kinase/adenosylcobinamide-phosphate guanylyltransferase [Domibacillus indicus]|uniref:bifunctional adenosylcobinamide kinase/adenosylcobinamide-phosphate guanylyltransferase n=1 Tax=Domibacillus indicus TaxID=1437523 RepID=UPI000617DB3A|nr:bifunctional adenosylcobinamide kinase/adenosylcobinamide-phosphate guanylyltransferase [Domibacillus indicus]